MAAYHLDGVHFYDAQALQLLLDAGADRTRAEQIREEHRHRRVVGFGDAVWGG